MNQLDSDVGLLKRGSEMASRDIVQFVGYVAQYLVLYEIWLLNYCSFREVASKGSQSIASEVLCEVSDSILVVIVLVANDLLTFLSIIFLGTNTILAVHGKNEHSS